MKRSPFSLKGLAFIYSLATGSFLASASAQSIDQTWLQTLSDNNWNLTSLNWDSAGVPGAWSQNNNAIFGGAGEIVSITSAIRFNDMTFNVGNYTIATGAGGSLTLADDLASTITVANAADTAVISSIIANSASGVSSLTKEGAGTLRLTGANTYTGATTVNAGVLYLLNNTVFPSTSAGITVANGAQLKVGSTYSLASSLSITGTGVGNTGALLLDTGARYGITNGSGFITISGTTSIGVAGVGSASIGALQGGGFTKVGTGTLDLSNQGVANTYVGTVTVAEGTLQSSKGSGITGITGDLIVNSGANWGGMNQSEQISNSSNVTVNGSFYMNDRGVGDANFFTETIGTLSGSGTIGSGVTTATGGGKLVISSSTANSSFDGSIALGTGGVVSIEKSGANTTLRLGGTTDTYTGTTTVTAGTLLVNATHTGGGAYTVASAGTIGGNANIEATSFTMAAGGKLTPGDGGIGTMTLGLTGGMNISAASNGTGAYLFELGASGLNDKIVLTLGTLNYGTLKFSDFTFTGGVAGGSYVLFDANSAITLTNGTLTGLIGGNVATLSYDATNFDIVLNIAPVPEPQTWAMLLVGGLLVGVFGRRFRRSLAS